MDLDSKIRCIESKISMCLQLDEEMTNLVLDVKSRSNTHFESHLKYEQSLWHLTISKQVSKLREELFTLKSERWPTSSS